MTSLIFSLLHAFSTLTVVAVDDLPEAMVEFLVLFGFAEPDEYYPNLIRRKIPVDPDLLETTFLGWHEEQHRALPLIVPGAEPAWSPRYRDPQDSLGRYYGIAVYLHASQSTVPHGPKTIKVVKYQDGDTILHQYSSLAPFTVWVLHEEQPCAVLQAVPTTSEWTKTKAG